MDITRTFICATLSLIILTIATPLLASDGWYLLVPPRSKYNKNAEYLSGYKILGNKPLSQWHQQGAYDTAAECESMKQNLTNIEQNTYSPSSMDYIKAVQSHESQTVLDFQRAIVETLNANVFALMASRCIKCVFRAKPTGIPF
jgi:hypothetical protein